MEIGIWKVTETAPRRYERDLIRLESLLEDWIEQDPSLLSAGLCIVGRQIKIDAGRLDLLGLDPVGNWVIVEMKRGEVRRETITQALDYAASIDEMSSIELQSHVDAYLKSRGSGLKQFLKDYNLDETIFVDRNLIIYVVGTSNDPHLDRLAKFFKKMSSLPLNIVNFDVFKNEAREQILVRQLTEIETESKPILIKKENKASLSTVSSAQITELDRLFELANKNGVGQEFRFVYEQATKHGLYPRLFKWTIMYTPPTNKSRVLIYVSVKKKHKAFHIYLASKAFAEFYPVAEKDAIQLLGDDGSLSLRLEDLKTVFSNLDKLFSLIEKNKG
jgi:hypothetical protein